MPCFLKKNHFHSSTQTIFIVICIYLILFRCILFTILLFQVMNPFTNDFKTHFNFTWIIFNVLTILIKFCVNSSENFTGAEKAFEWIYRWCARSFIPKNLFSRMTCETGQRLRQTLSRTIVLQRSSSTIVDMAKLVMCHCATMPL